MILQKIFVYIFSNFFQQFLGIFQSFATRRFIPPADFGIWVTINMIMGYCSYSNLGIFAAVYKEIPLYIGKKDHKAVADIKNVTGTFTMLVGIVVALIVFALSYILKLSPDMRIALRVMAVMLVPTFVFNLYVTLFRAYNDFLSLSKVIFLNTIGIFVLYVSFSYFWKLPGLYAAAILSLVGIILYTLYTKKDMVGFRFALSMKESKRLLSLLKIGIWLLVVGFCYTLMMTTERWVIIKQFGVAYMGYYSIAIMFFEGINQLSQLIAHVTFSKMQNLYGEMGKSDQFSSNAKKYVADLTLHIAYLVPAVIGLIYIWGGWLVALFIPKYMPGIMSMNVLIVGALFLGLSHFSSNFLLTIDKYKRTIPMLLIASAAVIGMSFVCISKGLGIAWIAGAATLGYFLFFIMVSREALKSIHSMREVLRFYFNIFGVLLYYTLLIFLCKKIHIHRQVPELLVQTIILVAGALPLLIKFNKDTGFLKKVLQLKAKRQKANA